MSTCFPPKQTDDYNDAQCGQAETSIGAIWCHNITISIADHCTKATLVNRTLQSNLRVYVEYRSCCRAGLAPGWDSDAWLQHASQDDLPVFNKPSSATHKNQKTHSLQDIRSVFFLLMSFRSPFARKKEKYSITTKRGQKQKDATVYSSLFFLHIWSTYP